MDKRLTDIVSYLTWVGLLIAFLIGERTESRFHMNQALVIWLAGTLFGLIGGAARIGCLFCALCWFIGFMGALQGTERPVPLLGRIKLL